MEQDRVVKDRAQEEEWERVHLKEHVARQDLLEERVLDLVAMVFQEVEELVEEREEVEVDNIDWKFNYPHMMFSCADFFLEIMMHKNHGGKTKKEKLKNKHLQYGDIWDCPHAGMLIAARMLDKTRRIIQLEYLSMVLGDFGDIKDVSDRIGDLDSVREDTLHDLKNYIKHYRRGRKKNLKKKKLKNL